MQKQWLDKIFFLICFVVFSSGLFAQSFFPDSLNRKQRNWLVGTEVTVYGTGMTGLYSLWYKHDLSTHFHFFNDADEWLQMDKAGHTQTAYFLSETSCYLYRSVGMKNKKAAWIGAAQGFLFQTSLELFDGFARDWGFSWSDMAANTLGTSLFLSQQLTWKEQRIRIKVSAHTTSFAAYRPKVLGSTFPERIVKDYNGQTYWLSGNVSAFLKANSRFPKWINIAFGYGASGMTGGAANPSINEAGQPIPSFVRYRQYYFSFDVDFSRIPVKKKWLRTTLQLINFIKVPFPAIVMEKHHVGFSGFYF